MATINFNLAGETITSEDGVVTIGDSNGALKVGAGTGIDATVSTGMLRYFGGELQVSNGTEWLTVNASTGGSSVSADDAFAVAVALS